MENNPLDIIKFIEGYGLKCYAFKKDHYFITDTYAELLEDVEYEYGKEIKEEVEKWALNSKENEEFRKYKMYICNIGIK